MSEPQFSHQPDEVQLAKILRESRPLLERYGTAAIYGMALLLAVAAVVVYIARRPPATAAESAKLLKAETPEEFGDIADNAPGTPIGQSAGIREGELILQNALRNLFTNRKVGLEELDQAEKIFRNLEDDTTLSEEGRLKVAVAIARITEARCDGSDASAKSATDAWDQVLKAFPDSKVFSGLAEERKKKLALPATKEFYAWFQQQNPAPGDTLGLPQDGPGAVPSIPSLMGSDPLQGLLPPAVPAAPKTDSPAPDAPATPDAPTTPDAPAAPDAPKTDAPAPDAPKADTPNPQPANPDAPAPAEQPSAPDAPKADAPAPEAPKTDAPAPDAPKSGE
ncbi:MAG: hypothetical protein RLZZ436_2604 [Planctomycetota bacterium]